MTAWFYASYTIRFFQLPAAPYPQFYLNIPSSGYLRDDEIGTRVDFGNPAAWAVRLARELESTSHLKER